MCRHQTIESISAIAAMAHMKRQVYRKVVSIPPRLLTLEVISEQRSGEYSRTADHHMAAAPGVPEIWKSSQDEGEAIGRRRGQAAAPSLHDIAWLRHQIGGPV